MDAVLLLNENIKTTSFRVKEGDSFRLNIAAFHDIKDCKIQVFVEKDATFDGVFADFSKGSAKINIEVILEGEGASGTFRTASLSQGEDKKTFDVSMIHQSGHSEGLVESYGVCQGHSRLVFTGVSKIDKGAKESHTHQSAKIIVFDEGCLGRCSPILKIDENSVKASHAAVVGKLNDDHLFYLLSRGLDLAQARKLITQGYLLPIASYYEGEERTMIEEAIAAEL